MQKFIVTGGKKLQGTVAVSGSKNVALKALVAACLTSEEVIIHNIPHISDFDVMVDIMRALGASVEVIDHTVKVKMETFSTHEIPLDKAAQARTSSMFISPLLARIGEAVIPNPGGCRLGARPIDRTIEGVRAFHVDVVYHSEDGYFHAKTDRLIATEYKFEKNTHTGTETLILLAALAQGKTVLKNAAEEPEIDDLIELLNAMGAKIIRSGKREITIEGVEKLHGAEYTISPDRNEIVTFAIAALMTDGDIFVEKAKKKDLIEFLEKLDEANGGYEEKENGIRFFSKGILSPTDVTTGVYPDFMTDWQAPWAVLMTKAEGLSTLHETVFENKFGYVEDLKRMGAQIELYNPPVENREFVYNFNLEDDRPEFFHAIKIYGPTNLHNGVMTMVDIRAGAAVVLGALAAEGTSTIFGIEKLDRGYEDFENRLTKLGADIKRMEEE
ncbi:MAG TPA: UDP-N-acetylglucosamine 1-carboxyvinyltransferase [Patescibacteria group bacterium]|nr:UDP-N-acetylglucosamine 1-carboxyvinyltransferase [Patescibacteria group bacterium]